VRNTNLLEYIKTTADGIRKRVLQHVIDNRGGYLSQACSSAEIFASLYLQIMNIGKVSNPIIPGVFGGVPSQNNPNKSGNLFNGEKNSSTDRFILSPAQYALVLYAALVEVGRMHPDGMLDFNKDGSTVEMIGAEHSPGMEVMTGSLGQGLSQAAGIAMARKLKKETGNVWVFMSDGEWQSGQNWEAIQAASYHKLNNLKIIIDANGCQCDGPVTSVMKMDPFEKRLNAFGAKVFLVDGNDINAILNAASFESEDQPLVIIANTKPFQGLDILKKRAPKFHYVRFVSEEERENYIKALEIFS